MKTMFKNIERSRLGGGERLNFDTLKVFSHIYYYDLDDPDARHSMVTSLGTENVAFYNLCALGLKKSAPAKRRPQ